MRGIGALNVTLLRRCLGRDLHRDARLAGEQARDRAAYPSVP